MSADDPFADIQAPDNVVPFTPGPPPGWEEDNPPYGEPMTAVERVPLPIQWFDDISMQLTGLWLVKHILPAIGIAVLYGHPGSGKTFLALDWALHVALGWEWQGRKVKKGVVVYVGAEGLSGLRNRVEAFRRHHGVKSVAFALIPSPIDLQAPDADVGRLIDAIRQAEEHFGESAAMIVIDTLSKTFGAGKENTDDMVTYVANCQRIANDFECLTMPVHHRPKDSESEDPRGHSSLKGGAETVIIVEAGDTKKARITKQKDGEDGIEMLFRLKVIELGEDEDGETVTSCVVEQTDVDTEPRGHVAAAKASRLPDAAKIALQMLDEATIASGIATPSEIPAEAINRLRVGKVVLTDHWRQKHAESFGQVPDIKPDTISKAFRRNLEKLQSQGIVRVWGDYSWRTWESRDPARTSSGHKPDMDKAGSRTSRTSEGSPYGGNPLDVRPMSDQASGGDWRENPLLNPEAKR